MHSFKKIFSIALFVATAGTPVFGMQPGDEEMEKQLKKEFAKILEWASKNAAAPIADLYIYRNPPLSPCIAPIHAAAYSGNLKSAKALMQGNFVDVNIVCNHPDYPLRGKTALHLAAEAGHVEMVKFLLENGAMATINTPVNNTEFECHNMNALDIALRERNFFEKDFARAPQLCPQYDQIIKILLSAGAQPSERHTAQS